ncbi:MAG TPA: ABC transporter permease [Bryobacteraceae bacterium]|nr:ABC transporter permease [Bryobacteraceae bacterium]
MSRIAADLKHGCRILSRAPGVTATALIALALAIGANTAMFSVVDAVLVRPLPFPDADRVVMVWEDASQIGFPRNTPAPANWRDWREQNTVFTEIAATRSGSFTITGGGPPEYVIGRRVTPSLWSVLGTRPVIGRTFTEGEDRGDVRIVVIGYGLWQRRFGGETSVIGRKMILNDEPYEVIGVMPARFSFPNRRTEIWTPIAFTPEDLAKRSSHFLQCAARLKPGVSVEQASAEMRVIARRLEQRYPDSNKGVGAVVIPISEQMTGNTRRRLLVLFGASGFVLLIACANIANLLLARAAGRSREMAVRAALGAGRSAIVRQLLTESLLLAGIGALLGVGLARAGMIALEKLIPAQMAPVDLGLDWRVMAFTVGATFLTGLLFGAFPALTLGRGGLNTALRQGGRGAAGAHRQWMRDGLVVAQTALALALMAGAGLLLRTLHNLQQVDLGMKPDKLLTLSTELPASRYPDHAKQVNFARSVLEKIRAIPGVVDAGYTSDLPLTALGNTNGYIVEGQTDVEANTQDALFRVVTPTFLETIGARLREGRFLTESDREGGLPVVLINETFANRHWPGQSPVGKRVDNSGSEPNNRRWVTIVGVVKEIRERGINIDTKPAVYMPLAQSEGYWPEPADLAIRTAVDPVTIVPAVRRAIGEVDKDQPLSLIRTMDDVVAEVLAADRQQMWLLVAFAALALVLAATGMYGVISYLVSHRRREIGVRIALGATPAGVLRTIMGRGLALVGGGTVLGLVLAIIGAQWLQSLLFGVQPQDKATIAIAAALLAAIGIAACIAPARSAARTDPAIVLREE